MIYNTKPGLTGIGSIVFRNEGKLFTEVQNKGEDPWKFYNDKVNPMKGTLEIWYQKQQSFLLDIKILVLTLKKVIMKDGVNNQTNLNMPTFKGTDNE